MFSLRQWNEVYTLIEDGVAPAINPGAITAGSAVQVAGVQCRANGLLGTAFSPGLATFNLGDVLECTASASVSPAGLFIQAWPTGAGPGIVALSFFNASGSTITPPASNYIIIARRTPANIT
jgi:hypothetical protein